MTERARRCGSRRPSRRFNADLAPLKRIHPARRHARRGARACRAHRLPARRARVVTPRGDGDGRAIPCAVTSTACPTCCSCSRARSIARPGGPTCCGATTAAARPDHGRRPNPPSAAPGSPALLARVALADQRAFAALYGQTSAHLYGGRPAYREGPAAAEEILQEAYVSVWHHAGSYDAAKSQPMTWLTSIVRNRCLDQLRRRELDTVTLTPIDDDAPEYDVADDGPTPAGAAARGRRRARGARMRRDARCRAAAGDRAGLLPGAVARRAGRAPARSRSAPSSRGCAAASSG